MKAFCSSTKCIGSQTKPAVEKIVEGKPDRCPDCGYALIWRKDRNQMRYLINWKPKEKKLYLGGSV
jgi:predicted RNA-binding Zn-ribbon protein involved in translation (DUF1610 family)